MDRARHGIGVLPGQFTESVNLGELASLMEILSALVNQSTSFPES